MSGHAPWWRFPVTLMTLSAACIIFAVIMLLTSCASGAAARPRWDGQGVVTNHEYDDPDDWTVQGMCISYNKDGWCTSRLPDQHYHDEAHWFVQVTSRDGREHMVEVSEAMHNRCRLGAHWNIDRCPG